MAAKLKDKRTSITTVPNILRSFAIFATPLISHWSLPLKPYSQETAQNFEKHVLQKCLRIAFYTYTPVNLYNIHKIHHNRCTLLYTH